MCKKLLGYIRPFGTDIPNEIFSREKEEESEASFFFLS
jgi:hypothetical protein